MRWPDLDAVVAIERDLFDDPWSPELFWSELAQGAARTYLVADEDGIAGYAGLAALPDEGYVQTLAVARHAQRHGLGATMLEALLHDAIARDLPQVGLEVRVDNAAAQALYRRYGFAPVGLRRGYYQPSGTDALVMVVDRERMERIA